MDAQLYVTKHEAFSQLVDEGRVIISSSTHKEMDNEANAYGGWIGYLYNIVGCNAVKHNPKQFMGSMLLLLFVLLNTLAWYGSMHPTLRLLCSAHFFPIGVLEYLDEEQVDGVRCSVLPYYSLSSTKPGNSIP